jgi:ActR/RegA family two-component response regulator
MVLQQEPLGPSELIPGTRAEPRAELVAPTEAGDDLALSTVEHHHISRVVQLQGGNLSRSARALGISLSTLKRKLGRHRPGGSILGRTGAE